ncbi:RBBP9/YdeN family alpha/beta hydrolase [Acetobacter sp.]|jgi:predicted alpha/beta hydrolase family esterase|uniref:RBBP9/YdeN family alpha/beta hydrolase n=1 Tax=Acetobacter sp. TaxID=440 RepID=UPI0025C6E044|nr:alpha/beta hydrolase [Acetobacter sp.]MCH4092669.1 alpha/beta hydrolase [Acetobacter sp.]MCI1301229.1 alpha/beta hydrolase [Acetobacter sp.]MCI1317490.1 alpha/beta hydrolase [Acetobacter sp.]
MRISSSFASGRFLPQPVSWLEDEVEDRLKTLILRLTMFDVLIVPGLDGSGERHWQSLWKNFLIHKGISVYTVKQADWTSPDLGTWRKTLVSSVQRCTRPVLVVAHSLGALLTVHCAELNVAGALLVAPADAEEARASDRMRVRDFAPLPQDAVRFPSVLVTSDNDEWLSPARARFMADCWGAELFPAGRVGHIGNRENLGIWREGFGALEKLLDRIDNERLPPETHEV